MLVSMTGWRWIGALAAAAMAAAAAWWLLPARQSLWRQGAVRNGNLLLVTIDTLRADRLNTASMPTLTALSHRGHVFTAAYAHAPLTLPSHASIMTGAVPAVHGVRGNGAFRLDEAHVTLAERLRAAGYRSGAFVGAFVLDSRFGLAQGFDTYDGVDDHRASGADFSFAERSAPEVLGRAADWILASGDARPWFAWVHLFDPHAPYDAPAEPAGYDGDVRFTDAALAAFLSRLDTAGALGRTAIVVTADHGEGLGEHGEGTHGLFVYDATTKVPLLIVGPDLGAGEHHGAVGHVDLVPTVLDILGLPDDPALPGQTLRRAADRGQPPRPVHIEAMDGWLTAGAAPISGVVLDGWKLIAAPIPELYNLALDAGETRNVYKAEPKRAHQLRQLSGRASLPEATTGAVPDQAAAARLQSLGYVSGGPRPMPGTFTERDDPKQVLPLYERFLAILAAGGADVAGLQSIIAERPAFIAARLAAASLLIDARRPDEAIALLAEPASAPDAALVLKERLGAAYLAAGQPSRAAAVLEPIVEDRAASADAWNALGVARVGLGRHAEARAAFDRASQLAPDAARIRFNAAVARLESGDRAGAVAEVEALVRRSPSFADGWKVAGTLRHEGGDRAGAVAAWQRAMALQPDDPDVLFNLAMTLRDLGRTDDARAIARRFIAVAGRSQPREAAALAPIAR